MILLNFKTKIHNPYFVAIVATMGGMLFGFDISSMSAFIDHATYKNYFDHPSAIRQAGITSSMAAGSLVGCFVAAIIGDKLGRRPIIQMSSLVWIVAAAIQAGSAHWGMLVAGRLIAGLAIGLASSSVPVYIAEMSPKHIRGRLVGNFQWSITWGNMIMFYISFGCGQLAGTKSFRIAWALQIIPGLLLFLGTGFLNESPRWLAAQGRWQEAIDIIAAINANGDTEDDAVRIEVEELKDAVRLEQDAAVGFRGMFSGKVNIRRTFIGIFCQVWQQLNGMNVMMYYIVNVFSMAGYTGNATLVASSIQYVINVVMTIPALLFIDKWGRRNIMLAGSILLLTWLVAEACIFAIYSEPTGPNGFDGNDQIRIRIPEGRTAASRAAIAVSYLFVGTFASSWGPVSWIYCSEIFPLEQRAVANSLTTAANWLMNFAIGMFTPSAFVNITWKTYIVFASFCFAMSVHIFLMFPETHNLTLEEINELWHSDIPAWKSGSFKPSNVPLIEEIKATNAGRAPSIKEYAPEHIEHESSESIDEIKS